jgi:hypothetical protein
VEPVNHWRPVTLEYQLEFMPIVEALPASKKKRVRARALSAKSVVHIESEAPLAVTTIQWWYFFRACAYFVLGSILLSYPSSQQASWLVAHSRILMPFQISATAAAPLINLIAETFFVLSIVSAILGTLWLKRSAAVRWITLCYAGLSLTRTVLYFVAIGNLVTKTVLTTNQTAVLLAGAVINLLIFGYVAFFPGVDEDSQQSV